MPDIFGASGQFAIDALGAQNQAALNNAYGSGGFGGTVGQYAPYPMFGSFIDTNWQPQSPFQSGAQPFYNPMSGASGTRGSPNYNPYSPQTYAPQTPSWFSGGGGGGFGGGGSSDFNSRFGGFGGGGSQMPQMPQLPSWYSRLGEGQNQNRNLGGPGTWIDTNWAPPGASPASLSMNPWLSLGFPGPQQSPNIDPHLEFNPYNPNQPQGFGQYRTLDQNIINPDIQNWRQQLQRDNQRDIIAQAMMPRPQVAMGVS